MKATFQKMRTRARTAGRELGQQLSQLHRRSKNDVDIRRLGIISIIATVMLLLILPPMGLVFLIGASAILLKG